MNQAQRLALTVALAVLLVVVAWSVVPFSDDGFRCGSAVTAASGPDRVPGRSRTFLLRPSPCPRAAKDRLLTGAVVVVLAGTFAAGSYRLLRD